MQQQNKIHPDYYNMTQQENDTTEQNSNGSSASPTTLSSQSDSTWVTTYKKVRVRLIPTINLVSFILVVIVNVLSSIGTLNNITTAKVSDEYFTSFTPKGWYVSFQTLYLL